MCGQQATSPPCSRVNSICIEHLLNLCPDQCLKFLFFSSPQFPYCFGNLVWEFPALPRVPPQLSRALFPFPHQASLGVLLPHAVLTCCEDTPQPGFGGIPFVLVETREVYSFHSRFDFTLRVWGLLFKDSGPNRASNADQALSLWRTFPSFCLPWDKTPFCPFIPLPSLLCGSVIIAGVLGIHANNEFSRATFLFFFFPSLSFFLKWLGLKRIIYQIIFIQLWRKKKEEKRWGEKPFRGFNCFAVSAGGSARLIKAHTAEAPRFWLSTASLEQPGSADGPDSALAIWWLQCLGG